MKKLNEKERAVFDYVCKISANQGYAPSVRDICAALNYKSTSTVQMYLDRLLEYGYLCREAGKKRSLRPADGMMTARRGEIRIARKTENGILTEACFDGQLPFYYGGAGESMDLFAFRMTEKDGFGEGEGCFGIVIRTENLLPGETGIFAIADGGFAVGQKKDLPSKTLLGKLIAVIRILT